MSNTEWKKGYEEGFAAGWRASKVEVGYKNVPQFAVVPTGPYAGTMADTGSYNVTLNETKTIRNLTDHTRIV